MAEIEGRFYDGRSSDFVYARLSREGDRLLVRRAEDGEVVGDFAWAEARVRERLGNTPRAIEFPGYMRFESSQFDLIEELFGDRGSLVHRLEGNWPLILMSIVLLLGVAAGSYRYVLPVAARLVAMRLPQVTLDKIGELSEKTVGLDEAESDLEDEDAARLNKAVDRLHEHFPGLHLRVVPMTGGFQFGANAFALPNGTVLITDELVELLPNSDEILGVLLHEAGHVVERHTVQLMIQGLAISGFLMVVAGQADWTSIAGALLSLNYSRDHEHEADAFAARELRAMKLKPSLLATALGRLEKLHKEHPDRKYGFLLSHPMTEDRVSFLKSQDR